MRIDELEMEMQIKQYPEILKRAMRKARREARELCDNWEQARINNSDLPHPLELALGKHLPQLHS